MAVTPSKDRQASPIRRIEKDIQLHRDLLVQVQKENYPDSQILSVQDVYSKWPSMPVDLLLSEIEEYSKRIRPLFDKSALDFLLSEKRRSLVSEYAACFHRSMALAMQHPIFIFYECGKDDHGKYKYKGFRYGVQPSEYASVVTPWG